MNGPAYRRLPWSAFFRLAGVIPSRSSLWLAEDHLLKLDSVGFPIAMVENYRRFYFQDIRAVIICADDRQTTGLITAAALIAGSLVVAAIFLRAQLGWPGAAVGFGLSALLGFIGVVLGAVVLTRGASCSCHIYSRHQSEILPSIHTLARAEAFLAEIEPRIREAQGSLDRAEILRDAVPMESAEPATQGRPGDAGTAHALFFAMMLGVALATGVHAASQSLATAMSLMMIQYLVAVPGLVALVQQSRERCPTSLRALTWLGMIYAGSIFLAANVVSVYLFAAYPELGSNPNLWVAFKTMARMSPFQDPVLLTATAAAIGICVPVGIGGLVMTLRHRALARISPES